MDQSREAGVAAIKQASSTAFAGDTTPRYDAEAAKLAWERTLDFFKKNLK